MIEADIVGDCMFLELTRLVSFCHYVEYLSCLEKKHKKNTKKHKKKKKKKKKRKEYQKRQEKKREKVRGK